MTQAVAAPAPAGRRSRVNPVLARELRGRMRGWRAPIIITVWLLATLGVAWLVHTATGVAVDDPFADPFANADLGRGIFDWVLFVMMIVMLFLVPGQAAGAIAGERDRQTLLPLQVSLLTPRQLLFGKVAASSAFLVLLMVAAMPVLAVAYVIGGVRIGEIVVGLLAVVATGVLLAAMVTSISALTKRVQGAVVLSYLLLLGLTVGPALAYGVAALVDGSRGSDETDPPEWLLVPDPFVAVADIAGDRFSGSVGSPWDGIWSVLHPDRDEFVEGDGVFVDEGFGGAGPAPPPRPVVIPPPPDGVPGAQIIIGEAQIDQFPVEGGGRARAGGGGVPYWARSLGAQAVLAAALLALAARRLRTPAGAER